MIGVSWLEILATAMISADYRLSEAIWQYYNSTN